MAACPVSEHGLLWILLAHLTMRERAAVGALSRVQRACGCVVAPVLRCAVLTCLRVVGLRTDAPLEDLGREMRSMARLVRQQGEPATYFQSALSEYLLSGPAYTVQRKAVRVYAPDDSVHSIAGLLFGDSITTLVDVMRSRRARFPLSV